MRLVHSKPCLARPRQRIRTETEDRTMVRRQNAKLTHCVPPGENSNLRENLSGGCEPVWSQLLSNLATGNCLDGGGERGIGRLVVGQRLRQIVLLQSGPNRRLIRSGVARTGASYPLKPFFSNHDSGFVERRRNFHRGFRVIPVSTHHDFCGRNRATLNSGRGVCNIDHPGNGLCVYCPVR